jgi:dihydroneopterin aldolase
MIYPTNKLSTIYYTCYPELGDEVTTTTIYYKSSVVKNELSKTYLVYSDEENNTIDEEECSNIFPCIKIVYQTEDENETKTKYLWFQNMIQVGDTVNVKDGTNFFSPNEVELGASDYLEAVAQSVLEDITLSINNGRSIDSIVNSLPYWVQVHADVETVIDNKNVTIIETNWQEIYEEYLTNEKLSELCVEIINAKVADYANNMLRRNGKELISDEVITGHVLDS